MLKEIRKKVTDLCRDFNYNHLDEPMLFKDDFKDEMLKKFNLNSLSKDNKQLRIDIINEAVDNFFSNKASKAINKYRAVTSKKGTGDDFTSIELATDFISTKFGAGRNDSGYLRLYAISNQVLEMHHTYAKTAKTNASKTVAEWNRSEKNVGQYLKDGLKLPDILVKQGYMEKYVHPNDIKK